MTTEQDIDRLKDDVRRLKDDILEIRTINQLSSTSTLQQVIEIVNKITGNRKRR